MRAACTCIAAVLVLCGLAATAAAADPSLEAVGGAAARTVPLQTCPKSSGDTEPAHTCTKTSGRPYRGGKLTVLIRNTTGEEKTVKVEYLPDGATEPQTLPGDSDRIFLVQGGTSSSSFFGSLFHHVTGKLTGTLLNKVEGALPQLAKLAVGRLGIATRLAESPVTAKLVARALRVGVEELAPAQIRGLAPTLEKLISPDGREVKLDDAETADLLGELGEALLPPGPQLAAEALKDVFEATAETVSESPLTVKGGKSLSISVGFAPPLSESASAIDGMLLVSTEGEKPLAIPVSGEERSFKGVTVSPATLSIDSGDGDAKLILEGPELVEYLRSHGGEEPGAILYGDDGETAEATLKLPTAAEVESGKTKAGTAGSTEGTNRAAVTVTVSGDPGVGKYTGKLALPELPTDTGATTIELHQHRSFVCAALAFILMLILVLIGIAVTGIGTRIVTMATRRKLLTDVLTQTYDVFVYVIKRKDQKGEKTEIASWHLDDLLGEDPRADGEPTPRGGRLQGLPALKESIETARSSADLDEDAARVLDMVARMQRWLRVEPLARRLALLEAKVKPDGGLPKDEETAEDGTSKPVEPLTWHDSRTLRDTRALLEMARREPSDAEKADDLVARLQFQIEWHRQMAAAWEAARDATQHLRRSKEVRALEEALSDESKTGTRDIGEQDGLAAQLEGLVDKHDDIEVKEIGKIEGEEISDEGRALGITPVVWKASPNLFTGWATLDAQSYGQLARRAATSSRARYMPDWDVIRSELSPDKADAAWTLAILVFASAAYGATTYSETWGSAKDFATAFLAGSLGKVTIDWAALPIFQSIRLRKAKAS